MTPDDRRAQLLGAARTTFARLGYHDAAVSDILEEAGVARGTFYNYFESKREVFGAVLDTLLDDITQAIHLIDVGGDIPLQVKANLKRVLDVMKAEGTLVRLLFVDAAGIDDEGRDALARFYGAATGRIERALHTGQTLGLVPVGDTKLLAACLLGTVKEPVFQAFLQGTELDSAALTEVVFGLVTRGVLGG